MSYEIIPAILPENIGDLRGKVAVVKGFISMVQIDFCDGKFVDSKTWPYNQTDVGFYNKIIQEEDGLPFWEEMNFEFDLMVKNAHKDFENILKLGPRRIIFHLDAEDDLLNFFETLDPFYLNFIEWGIALDRAHSVHDVRPFLPYIASVQCMGIARIGHQGEPFDRSVLKQIKSIKESFPDLVISVDGAVSRETIHDLVQAGATRFVVGSAIYNEIDPEEVIEDLKETVI